MLADLVPNEVVELPRPGWEYQRNRFYCWSLYDDDGEIVRRGVIYTNYCSRKRMRAWAKDAKEGGLEIVYLVESNRALRHKYSWIKFVVSPIFGEDHEVDDAGNIVYIPIRFGTRVSNWPKARVETALRLDGTIAGPNGRDFDEVEDYENYMRMYNRKNRVRK